MFTGNYDGTVTTVASSFEVTTLPLNLTCAELCLDRYISYYSSQGPQLALISYPRVNKVIFMEDENGGNFRTPPVSVFCWHQSVLIL